MSQKQKIKDDYKISIYKKKQIMFSLINSNIYIQIRNGIFRTYKKIVYILMGCCAFQNKRKTIPVQNHLVQLLILGKNKQVKKRVKEEGIEITRLKINFIGDTILHYACKKNNRELVHFFKKIGADFTIKNQKNQTPMDLTRDLSILKIIGAQPKLSIQNCLTQTNSGNNTQTFDESTSEYKLDTKVMVIGKINRKKQYQQSSQEQIAQENPQINLPKDNEKLENSKRFSIQLSRIIKSHMEEKQKNFSHSH